MEKIRVGYFSPAVVIRLLALLMFVFVPVSIQAQEQTVLLPTQGITVEQAIGQIESQAGLIVGVNHKKFDVTRRINADSRRLTVGALLDRIVAGSGHTYIIKGKHVLIMPEQKPEPKPKPEPRPAQPEPVVEQKIIVYEPVTVEQVARRYNVPQNVEIKIIEHLKVNGPAGNSAFSFSVDDPATFSPVQSRQPGFAVKTNLGYGAATLTPNLGVEFGIGRFTTMEITGGWNPWNRRGSFGDNKKHVHSYVQTEFRWWTGERFAGHFFGIHALGVHYNISGHNMPLLKFKKQYRYQGYAAGAGVSYGYSAVLSAVVGLEFNLGVGAVWLDYDRYRCEKCDLDKESFTKTRFAPTKAAISLVFIIK